MIASPFFYRAIRQIVSYAIKSRPRGWGDFLAVVFRGLDPELDGVLGILDRGLPRCAVRREPYIRGVPARSTT